VARRGDGCCRRCCRRLVRHGRPGEQGITVGGARRRDLAVRHGWGGVLPPLGLGPSRRHEGQSFRRQGGGSRRSRAGGKGHGRPGGCRNWGGCRRGAGVGESARRGGAGSHLHSNMSFAQMILYFTESELTIFKFVGWNSLRLNFRYFRVDKFKY
jgi:hypothetical protein